MFKLATSAIAIIAMTSAMEDSQPDNSITLQIDSLDNGRRLFGLNDIKDKANDIKKDAEE